MQQKDPWQWVILVSLVFLAGTGWDWRNNHRQATALQKELTALERDYRTTLAKLKKTREQQRRLQYDVDEMKAQNTQLEETIRENEGSNIMIQQYTDTDNIDHEEYAQAEQLEEIYLTRIDELQEQIRAWNEKLLYQEYIFRNRFPHFIITCRVLGGANQKAQDVVMFKVRLPNIQMFPVEISSLSQMVKQQDCNGVQMRFRKTFPADDNNYDNNEGDNAPLLRLEQLSKPGGILPEWPFKHHVAVNRQNTMWYVITEKAPSLLLGQQQQRELVSNNFGQIMIGEEFLQQFVESSEETLTLQVLSAERVLW